MRCAFSLVRQSTRSSKHYDRTRRPWQGPDIDKPGFPQERLAPFKSHQTTTSECRSQPEKVAFNGPLPGFAIANRSHPPGVTLVRIFAGSRNCLDRDEGTGEPRRDRRRLSARSPLPSVSRSRMRSVRPARRTFSRAGARAGAQGSIPTTLGDGHRYRQTSNATPTSKNDPSGDPIPCESCGTLVCVQRVSKARRDLTHCLQDLGLGVGPKPRREPQD